MANAQRILGIDPGLRRTGFGVVQARAGQLSYIASGTIQVPTDLPLYERLKTIYDAVLEVAATYQPTIAAIEKVFVNTNPHSTLLLGQARGAALCGLASSGLHVLEYTALQIKKSVVGQGHAQKHQVQSMVRYLLKLGGDPAPDAADALACAICHAHASALQQLTGQEGMTHGRLK